MTLRKATQNAIVDILALCAFVPMVVSGMVLFRFWRTGLGGLQGGRNPVYVTEFMGLDHEGWVLIHDVTSVVFTILVAVHLILHWKFMRNLKKHLSSSAKESCEDE